MSISQLVDPIIQTDAIFKNDNAALGIKAGQTYASKTWNNFNPNPAFVVCDGENAASISDVVATLVKTNEMQYTTVAFTKSSLGWFTSTNNQRNFKYLIKNRSGGVLWSFDFYPTVELVIKCTDHDKYVSYTMRNLPDIYDDAAGARLTLTPISQWSRC